MWVVGIDFCQMVGCENGVRYSKEIWQMGNFKKDYKFALMKEMKKHKLNSSLTNMP